MLLDKSIKSEIDKIMKDFEKKFIEYTFDSGVYVNYTSGDTDIEEYVREALEKVSRHK